MKVFKLFFVFILILAMVCFSQEKRTKTKQFPVLKGPYFGQEPPAMTPELFAPEILSRTQPQWAFCSVFSPCGNEFYFSEYDPVKKIDKIMCMKRVNNTWQQPQVTSFSGKYNDNDLRISPDGYRIFWRSWRPLPGSNIAEKRSVIWFATRTEKGWNKAQPLKCGEVILRAGYLSITYNGTLYLPARGDDSIGKGDIYRSRFVNGSYSTPEHLGGTINTKYSEGDLCIAPDESFIIVSCWDRPDNKGESDLYISFRKKDGSWTTLKNMGEPINTKNNENCPTISPDGKYFFYISVDVDSKRAKCNTYWVDAKIIATLKPGELK